MLPIICIFNLKVERADEISIVRERERKKCTNEAQASILKLEGEVKNLIASQTDQEYANTRVIQVLEQKNKELQKKLQKLNQDHSAAIVAVDQEVNEKSRRFQVGIDQKMIKDARLMVRRTTAHVLAARLMIGIQWRWRILALPLFFERWTRSMDSFRRTGDNDKRLKLEVKTARRLLQREMFAAFEKEKEAFQQEKREMLVAFEMNRLEDIDRLETVRLNQIEQLERQRLQQIANKVIQRMQKQEIFRAIVSWQVGLHEHRVMKRVSLRILKRALSDAVIIWKQNHENAKQKARADAIMKRVAMKIINRNLASATYIWRENTVAHILYMKTASRHQKEIRALKLAHAKEKDDMLATFAEAEARFQKDKEALRAMMANTFAIDADSLF